MWAVVIRVNKVKLPWMLVTKIVFCSALASLTAHYIAMRLAPLWGILCGGSAALFVLFGLLYLLRVMEPEDHGRFKLLAGMLPKPIARPANKVLSLLAHLKIESAAPTNL
jgi:hypothetical protein